VLITGNSNSLGLISTVGLIRNVSF